MALHISDDVFGELLHGDKPLVVDFWAEWCGPCKMISPIVEELASEYEGRIVVGKVNIDDNEDLAVEYNIRSIPTILFFKDGELVNKHVGATSKSVLEDKIKMLI